jgi:rare lipoprotein A
MGLGQQPTGLGRAQMCVLAVVCLAIAGCTNSARLSTFDPRYGVSSSPRLVALGQAAPKGGGYYRVGDPYTIGGRTYVPAEDPNYRVEGVASWYGEDFHGRRTANGEIFDMQSMSAAHTTLPLPSYARVTNLSNGKSVVVRVNDRGPYSSDRLIDVSAHAANLLGFIGSGLAPVRVEYVGPAPLEGSDDNMLMATLREGGPAPAPPGVRVASNRPYLPDMPVHALREVPVPPNRPYSLGEGQMHSNYRPIGGPTYARGPEYHDRDRVVLDAAAVAPRDLPLAAYAPARSNAQHGDLPLPAPAAPAGSFGSYGPATPGMGLY